jgi:hypothetical protein
VRELPAGGEFARAVPGYSAGGTDVAPSMTVFGNSDLKRCHMNLFTRIVCFTLIIAALLLIAFRGSVHSQSSGNNALATAERISGDHFRYYYRTRSGVQVYSADRIGAQMLDAIDKGFTDLFEIAESSKYRFRNRLRYSDYTVFVGRPDRTEGKKGNYSPDIAVGAAQYAGSRYDQGGYVYAAGMVISADSCAFLIAEHTKDFERVSRVVRYEGEHIVLYHNNRQEYLRTLDHSKGGGHPILN